MCLVQVAHNVLLIVSVYLVHLYVVFPSHQYKYQWTSAMTTMRAFQHARQSIQRKSPRILNVTSPLYHGLTWRSAPAGVTVDKPDRANVVCRLNWGDGLGNDRSPYQYFSLLYPRTHIDQMIKETNVKFERAGIHQEFTRQEFFVYVGLLFACSLYTKFTLKDLFSPNSDLRRSEFLQLPDYSKHMKYNRFKNINKHLTFASDVDLTVNQTDRDAFWQIQPLVDAFNNNRKNKVVPGNKLVGDESTSPWRGKDQRYGKRGCPQTIHIIRKPKPVCMEIKNLACCTSGIMMAMEVVAPKKEMAQREYHSTYGSGTSLLLRLAKPWKGSGRLVVADSAFASVKTAVALKNHLGLYFHGLVKTAHRKFPKKYLNELEIEKRGDHVVLVTREEEVDLIAVSWNDGKKHKKTGKTIKKNIIASCGTTLPSAAHRKRRWHVGTDGYAKLFFKDIPRPQIVAEYYQGAQKIDVHNHYRQGRHGVALEQRATNRWDMRFFQTFLGIIEVDAFLAYKRWCPGKTSVSHVDFLRELIQDLLCNKEGCAHNAPVLRPRPAESEAGSIVHKIVPNRFAPYFAPKVATHTAAGKKIYCALRCRTCGKNCSFHCAECSNDTSRTKGIVALCGPGTGRKCFEKHHEAL